MGSRQIGRTIDCVNCAGGISECNAPGQPAGKPAQSAAPAPVPDLWQVHLDSVAQSGANVEVLPVVVEDFRAAHLILGPHSITALQVAAEQEILREEAQEDVPQASGTQVRVTILCAARISWVLISSMGTSRDLLTGVIV